MLNSFEISKKLNVAYSTIRRAINNLEFIPVEIKKTVKYYDNFQIGLLVEHLENKGIINNNLRDITEIAKLCSTDYYVIQRIIAREKIKPIKINPLRFNENQQNIIFAFLYYETRMQYLTFESKMNNADFDAPFYSDRLDFIKNGNLTPKGNY